MNIELTAEEKVRRELESQRGENFKLRRVLRELFDALDNATQIARVVLYAGSVALAWFYLKDHALAVGIAASLTVAHLIMEFREYIAGKRKELTQ